MKITHILGIDISKDKFDVCLRSAAAAEQKRACTQFDNNPSGFKKLQRWLAHQAGIGPLHACLEATSRYGDALALFLHEHQHAVSVVNPRRIRHYADSQLVRTQNDTVDAAIIADFCATQTPPLWQPTAADVRQLQDLTRLRQFFVTQAQRQKNRLQTESPALARFLRRQIKATEKLIAKLETQIAEHLQAHAPLAQKVALVDSISGVGPLTAAAAVAELPPVQRFEHAGQVVAFAGLDPRKKDSGSSVRGKGHVSKMGSRPLRGALYMPAVAALTHNPLIRAQGKRMAARGHSGKTIICAAMRKLVRLIYGVLKTGKPFDAQWANPTGNVPGERAGASGGDEPASPTLASPPVATA
jgi:transposase